MFGLTERTEKLPAYLHVLLFVFLFPTDAVLRMEHGGNNQPKNNKSDQRGCSAHVSWIY